MGHLFYNTDKNKRCTKNEIFCDFIVFGFFLSDYLPGHDVKPLDIN